MDSKFNIKNLNLKQLSKEQVCTFRILDSKDNLIHEFKSKNIIKLIYEEFKRVLLDLNPENNFDYAAFHAHYKTMTGRATLKRRYSIRGYHLEVDGPVIQYSSEDDYVRSVYEQKLADKKILKKSVLHIYTVHLVSSDDSMQKLIYVGEINGDNFTVLQKRFESLTNTVIKSKGIFNKCIQRVIKTNLDEGYESFRNFIITPKKLTDEEDLS